MSKTKLGRNPFEKQNTKKKAAGPKKTARPAHQTAKSKRKQQPEGLLGVWREITYYWVPRIRACAYVRAVKLASRFT